MSLEPSLEKVFCLMEENREQSDRLNTNFESLDFFWAGEDYLRATRRNNELLVNQFRLPRDHYTRITSEEIISEINFHLFNYTNSYVSMRDFLYNGYEDSSDTLGTNLHSIVTSWKNKTHQRIINEMRNRCQHGGKLIRGIRTYSQTVANPDGPKWVVGIFLFDRAIRAIRSELPSELKDTHVLFDAMTANTMVPFDIASFLEEAQESLETTYNLVNGLLKTHYANMLKEYETIKHRIEAIEQELKELGFTEWPP